jgi:hypothetical protein
MRTRNPESGNHAANQKFAPQMSLTLALSRYRARELKERQRKRIRDSSPFGCAQGFGSITADSALNDRKEKDPGFFAALRMTQR